MRQIVDRVLSLGQQGQAPALAVVTEIDGSAYRRPGAKLLIEASGCVVGGVSGGCLEEDVRQVGLAVLRSGCVRALSYDTSSDETTVFGLGLGCGGRVDIAVLPITSALAGGVFAALRDLLDGEAPFALSIPTSEGAPPGMLATGARDVLAGTLGDRAIDAAASAAAQAALEARRSARHDLASGQLFTEVLLPPAKLLVCGGGEDARPLVELAASVGFRVYVADHRGAHLAPERFTSARKLFKIRPQHPAPELPCDGGTYAVVKTHSFEHDKAWIQRLLATDVAYIGVLGPKARVHKILTELGAQNDGRVFGPVGLDLGADGPEQVALSVVAELLAVSSGHRPGHLRDKEAALHAAR
jgi:xanthine/CO dehydrogenase XdhC/CoxF family maturation factor